MDNFVEAVVMLAGRQSDWSMSADELQDCTDENKSHTEFLEIPKLLGFNVHTTTLYFLRSFKQ